MWHIGILRVEHTFISLTQIKSGFEVFICLILLTILEKVFLRMLLSSNECTVKGLISKFMTLETEGLYSVQVNIQLQGSLHVLSNVSIDKEISSLSPTLAFSHANIVLSSLS